MLLLLYKVKVNALAINLGHMSRVQQSVESTIFQRKRILCLKDLSLNHKRRSTVIRPGSTPGWGFGLHWAQTVKWGWAVKSPWQRNKDLPHRVATCCQHGRHIHMKFWQPWTREQIFLVLWENLGISHKKLKSWPPTCATCISTTQVIQIKHETWAKIDICFWAFCKFYLWKSFDILQLWFHDSKAITWRGKAKLFSASPKNFACCRKWGYGWIV